MAIQEDSVRVTFTNMERAEFRFRLEDSPAFDYGSGTCVVVEQNGCQPMMLDTRYDERVSKRMSAEDFADWCGEWLRENYQVFMVERTVQLGRERGNRRYDDVNARSAGRRAGRDAVNAGRMGAASNSHLITA